MSGLIRASIWLSLSELAFNLSGYIIHSLMGRLLGPANYGRFNIVITFSTMIFVLFGRGLPIAMSKLMSETTDENKIGAIKKVSFKIQILMIIFLTAVYYLLAPVCAQLLRDQSLTNLFRISSLIIPTFMLATYYVYYFNGIHRFGTQSFLKFIRSIFRVLLIVGLGYFYKVAGAIWGQVLAPLFVSIFSFFADPYKKKIKVSPKEEKEYKNKLLSFTWPITLFLLFYELMISIDLYLVKAILGDDRLTGIYSASLNVSRIPYYAFYFLTMLLLPKVSQMTAQKTNGETSTLLKKSFKFLFILLIPSIALLHAFSPSVIRFFYGSRYSDGSGALNILLYANAFLTVFYILTFVLNGGGKTRLPLYFSLFGAILNSALNYIFIQHWGIIGSASATAITALVTMIGTIFYTEKFLASFLEIKSILKYFIFSGLIYFLAINFFPQGRFIFILWSVILMMVYLGALFLTKEISIRDWNFFLLSLKKKRIKNQ